MVEGGKMKEIRAILIKHFDRFLLDFSSDFQKMIFETVEEEIIAEIKKLVPEKIYHFQDTTLHFEEIIVYNNLIKEIQSRIKKLEEGK